MSHTHRHHHHDHMDPLTNTSAPIIPTIVALIVVGLAFPVAGGSVVSSPDPFVSLFGSRVGES